MAGAEEDSYRLRPHNQMVNTEDLSPFMQQSDEMLLARIETLEQEVENLERRIEALEHRSSTTSEPAGKMRRLAGRCQLLKSS